MTMPRESGIQDDLRVRSRERGILLKPVLQGNSLIERHVTVPPHSQLGTLDKECSGQCGGKQQTQIKKIMEILKYIN